MRAKFADVLEIRNGKNQRKVENPQGKYPIYGSGGVMGYADDFICDAETVVIGRKGSINNPIFVNEPFWNVDTAFGLVANGQILLPKYLYYFCVNYNFEELNTTVTIPSLTKANLLQISIDVPELTQQKAVVEKLDKIEHLVSLRKQQLAKLDELVKARFVEMFGDCKTNPKGWKTQRLEEIAEVGSSKRVFVDELKEGGIPFYRGTEVGALAEGKSIIPELYITEQHYKELCNASGTPKRGDLLMPSICPDGRIWVVDTDEPFYFKDGRVLWVHGISNSYNSIFLLYTLKDRIMTDYSSIASGTTFAELKIFALKACNVFDVPQSLQTEFAAFVQSTDQVKSTVQSSLDELETLKKSLMQTYFG
ncbi:MAG: restriction endonuclease subunit S [Clostridiales bacterium]|nr:restriction endonuclease subunit S [Clostridiales bacterium]